MKNLQNSLMGKATQLTAQGRLGEATSLLRSLCSGHQLSAGKAESVDVINEFPTHTRQPAESANSAGRFEWRTYLGASGTLRYKVYVPKVPDISCLPIVVMLHGCRQTPDDFALGTGMNLIADENSFLVVYPEQTGKANASRCWNWFQRKDQVRDRGEPDLIVGLTRQVCAEFSADASKIYIAGLSAGAAAALNIGLLYPDVFASIGVHSGLASLAASDLPSALAAMRSGNANIVSGDHAVPTIVFHGDSDGTVNIVNARHISQQAVAGIDTYVALEQGQSSDNVSFTRTTHKLDSDTTILEEWIVHGGSHAWFGGDRAGSYTAEGPNASLEMWRFFSEHRLCPIVRANRKCA